MPTTKTTFHWSSLANALGVRDLVRGLLSAREAAPARHLALAEGAVHSLHVREPLEITALAGATLAAEFLCLYAARPGGPAAAAKVTTAGGADR